MGINNEEDLPGRLVTGEGFVWRSQGIGQEVKGGGIRARKVSGRQGRD